MKSRALCVTGTQRRGLRGSPVALLLSSYTVALFPVLILGAAGCHPSSSALGIAGDQAGPAESLMDYAFTNELNQPVRISDFRGRALAITFVFTRCPMPNYCPRLTKNFEEASRTLAGRSDLPANWHFLSVTIDPEYDTPEVLKVYGQRHGYDPRHWSFLTGPADKIAELSGQSGVTQSRSGGAINHNFSTLVIDTNGNVQASFPVGGDLSEAIVAEMAKALGR